MTKVFCIGFSKTGTTSLSVALRSLGYRTIGGNDPEWPPVEDFDAIGNERGAAHFEELDKKYPNSRFIFTRRNQEDWLRSLSRHLEYNAKMGLETAAGRALYSSLGYDKQPTDSATLFSIYDQHEKRVLEYFSGRDDLLVIDVCGGEGWERLCPFLNKPIPADPFPHDNAGKSVMSYYKKTARRFVKRVGKAVRQPLKR